MSNPEVHIDTSLDGVVKQSAVSITGKYMCSHPEHLLLIVKRRTGSPLDMDGGEMPTEGRLVLDGFTAGVAFMLRAVITGQLNIACIKQKIKG